MPDPPATINGVLSANLFVLEQNPKYLVGQAPKLIHGCYATDCDIVGHFLILWSFDSELNFTNCKINFNSRPHQLIKSLNIPLRVIWQSVEMDWNTNIVTNTIKVKFKIANCYIQLLLYAIHNVKFLVLIIIFLIVIEESLVAFQ